jgi:hypothetical protein
MTSQDPQEPFEAEVRASFRRHLDGLDPLIPTTAPPLASLDRGGAARISPRSRRSRPRAMGPAAALAVLVVVVAVAALLGPAMLRTQAPAVSPSASVLPTKVQGIAGPWTRLAPLPVAAGPVPNPTLAAWHDGFSVIDESAPSATVWFSRDGAAWSHVVGADSVFANADISWLVAAPGGFVAVGTRWLGSAASSPRPSRDLSHPSCGYGAAAMCSIWFSADGLTWRLVETGSLFSGLAGVVDVAAGPSGVVAIGLWLDPWWSPPPLLWYSADGSAWSAVDVSRQMGSAGLRGVAARPSGFEIVGTPRASDLLNDVSPGAWWSLDGLVWAPASIATDQNRDWGTWMQKVFVGQDGMVALAGSGRLDSVGTSWSSPDGRTWQPDGLSAVTPLIADGRRIVGERTDVTELEQSYDGSHWTPLVETGAGTRDAKCRILAISPTGLLMAGPSCPVQFLAGLP